MSEPSSSRGKPREDYTICPICLAKVPSGKLCPTDKVQSVSAKEYYAGLRKAQMRRYESVPDNTTHIKRQNPQTF